MLHYIERGARARAEGLLILHHGRGADERDLFPLADALDPEQRLRVVTPRAPLARTGTFGYHWYRVPRVGHPDPDTFHSSYALLAGFHDALWQRTGLAPEQTVLGGFSMGSVMSYATGLGPDRPPPAGILVFSGFLPTVEGFAPDLTGRTDVPVFVAHGRMDSVIIVDFARRARDTLRAAGFSVDYHESGLGHQIDPRHVAPAIGWLEDVLAPESAQRQSTG